MPRMFARPWTLSLCIPGLLLVACSGDGGSGGGPTGPTTLTIAPARAEYATFESARVTVRGTRLMAGSYQGSLGSASITAERTSDSTAVFIVPEVGAGTHTLTLTVGRSSATAQLTIRTTAPIDDPIAHVEAVDSLLVLEVEEMEEWYQAQDPSLDRFLPAEGYAADIAMMRATLAELEANFRALSPADQRQVAMRIQAYRQAEAAAAGALAVHRAGGAGNDEEEYFPQCQWPDVATVEEMRTCRRQHRDAMVQRAKTVEQCVIDFDAQWAEGDYVDAVGDNYIAYECLKARMLKLKRDVAETVRATVIGWFSSDPANAKALALYDLDAYGHSFVSGEAWPHYMPFISFRNMHAEDIGRLPAATELAALMQEYQEGWDELNGMFPRPFQQSPPWLHQQIGRAHV